VRANDTRRRKRLILAAAVVLVVVITVLGVLQLTPGGEEADSAASPTTEAARDLSAAELANRFLDALTAGDATAAGAVTDDPKDATATIARVWRGMAPEYAVADRARVVEPKSGADAVDEPFTLTWELGAERTWAYDSTLRVVRGDDGWRVRWQPMLIHPQLRPGQSLVLRDRAGQPAVVDRSGTPLLTWTETEPTAATPAVAPLLLPGMTRVASRTGGVDGWYVALADQAGKDRAVLHGRRTEALTSTVSRSIQQAAQAAVDAQSQATLLVAIQPSTGDLLAVAQNQAAGNDLGMLQGLYPPGSTFKLATATAILESGAADTGTVVPCPGSVTVGGRTVRNANFALGDVPLRTAFAQSCNTTFAMQAAKLPPARLAAAAGELGLNADFDIPGISTEAGAARPAVSAAEQVENAIGQGKVLVSCFGMALMTSTIAAGHAVTPSLWRELKTTVNTGYRAPSAAVLGSVRSMMRDVVTSGRGSALARYGAVHGKTGTAQVGDGTRAHGWFTGYRDDVAFAVVVLDGSSSDTAVAVTGRFLAAVG
jgi:beta-lactamase class D